MDEKQVFDALLRQNLYAYTMKAFGVIEPATPFEDNWHIGCISEHLEASFNGEIQWLIINEPPRCLKSVQVAQIYPSWVLGKEPSHQFIGASYGHSLAERNVMKTRQIIQSEMYRELFPSTHISADNNRKDFFTTTQNGQYKGTGIGGTITGFGCKCVDGDTLVTTNLGKIKIKDIKAGKNNTLALSLCGETGKLVWKKIRALKSSKRGDIYEVRTQSGRTITCTGDHPFFTARGYVEAKELRSGEELVEANEGKIPDAEVLSMQFKLREDSLRGTKGSKARDKGNILLKKMRGSFSKKTFSMHCMWKGLWKEGAKVLLQRMQAESSKADGKGVRTLWCTVYAKEWEDSMLFKGVCKQDALNKNDGRGKLKIQGWKGVLKEIQGATSYRNECGQQSLRKLQCERDYDKDKSPYKQEKDEPCCSPHRREDGKQQHTKPCDPLFELSYNTSQIKTDRVDVVERLHCEPQSVYDIEVEDSHNFFANGILVHNSLIIDDPINPKEAVSDTIRINAINEIRSTLFSRFNKYSEGRLVMIMQRLHEADPTGELLSDGGYYHLKLPAIAPKSYMINLNGKTWKQEEGEYLTPRLGEEELSKLRTDLREYHFAGQYLQEPVPTGGGEFQQQWVNHYPQGSVKPREMNVYILVDPAGGDEMNKKKKKTSDWTAMMVVGLAPDNNYYLLDVVRDRLNPTERVDTLFILHRKWNALCGKPPKVGYEKYGMMTDTHYIKDKMARDTYHFSLVELGGSVQKEERIRRLIPDMQIGRWHFPSSLTYVDCEGRTFDLIAELVKSEMPNFPRARFDDMLDALSRIYEPDLYTAFPMIAPSQVQTAYDSMDDSSDDWENF